MGSDRDTVLLTGASKGLGLTLAKQLIRLDRHHLILTARSASLDRFKKEGIEESQNIWLRSLDVTSPPERAAIVQEACEKRGGIDILINNAGLSYRSVLEHVQETDGLQQMNINYRSPMQLIRLVLPRMREKRRGRIVNISSVGGMMAMPTMGVYSASKFALEGASEALWYEVKPWNIKVSLVQPGFIRSESFKNVRMTSDSQRAIDSVADAYHQHYHHMSRFIERLMSTTTATPEKIAKVVLKILSLIHI